MIKTKVIRIMLIT